MMECPVQCGRNAHAAPGFFSLAGTVVKASGTDAQPDAVGSVLRGLGSFPNKQKVAFVSRKLCLQKSEVHKILSTRNRLRLDFPRGLEYNYCDYLWKLLGLDRRIVWAIYQSDRQRKNGTFRQDGSVIFATPDEFPEQ